MDYSSWESLARGQICNCLYAHVPYTKHGPSQFHLSHWATQLYYFFLKGGTLFYMTWKALFHNPKHMKTVCGYLVVSVIHSEYAYTLQVPGLSSSIQNRCKNWVLLSHSNCKGLPSVQGYVTGEKEVATLWSLVKCFLAILQMLKNYRLPDAANWSSFLAGILVSLPHTMGAHKLQNCCRAANFINNYFSWESISQVANTRPGCQIRSVLLFNPGFPC